MKPVTRRVLLSLCATAALFACKQRSGTDANNLNAAEEESQGPIRREFRGAWISTVYNLDWPSKTGLSADQQKQEMRQFLDDLKKYRINAVLLQVRPEGDAVYKSTLEPWSRYLSGTQGKDPGYDPLEFFVQEAHARGMEAHAWFNPYRAKVTKASPVVKPHLAATRPDLVFEYANLAWMDPGAKEVQDHSYKVVMDVVNRYDIDGIHIDDYFYPYPNGTPLPDNKSYDAYKKAGGKLGVEDWRRHNVDVLIERIAKGVKASKPWVDFGISPFGLYRPNQPEGYGKNNLDQYTALYADPKKWMDNNWIDYSAPQLYWEIGHDSVPFEPLLAWWTKAWARPTYAGSAPYKIMEEKNPWPATELLEQAKLVRKHRANGAKGFIYFKAINIAKNHKGVGDELLKVFDAPALPLELNYDNRPAPVKPDAAGATGKINISHKDAKNLRWFVVADGLRIVDVFPANKTEIAMKAGTYHVSAVDKFGIESEHAVVTVK